MRRIITLLIGAMVSSIGVPSALGQGLIAPSAGPINSAMAGASTAAPVDFGSTYWNPANLSGLERPEFLLGSGLSIPSTHLTTTLPAGTIGGVFPPHKRFGVARRNNGGIPAPATRRALRPARHPD